MQTEHYRGRLELTWTNKDQRLLADADGSYTWLSPADYRVAEVRLLHTVGRVGTNAPERNRARANLLIRGDALNALTSLARLPEFGHEYAGKVKLAYLDPPFNTQQSFLHYDDALEHSVWLTMMRDRLAQIRALLAPAGSVWVHCDDSEQHRLRCVMDEVFGAACYIATIAWRSSDNSNNDAKQFSTDHNYLLVYGRSEEWVSEKLQPSPDQVAHFRNPDNDPRGPWFDGNPVNSPNPRENLRYTIVTPTGKHIPPPPNGWRWSQETLRRRIAQGEIRFTANESGIRRRTYLKDHLGLPASSLWVDLDETGHNRQAKSELKRLFPGRPTADLFPTPKPERLIGKILSAASVPGDIVLDCFLGSGTTAAVAHKMGRRWVGIEINPETVSVYSEPRLRKVVDGSDRGGVTEAVNWKGGGGFEILDVAPSMFRADEGSVFLSEWATNGKLAEVTAAQLNFEYKHDPPFCGRLGRSRLAVVDGLVNEDVVRLLVTALGESERLIVCGTAIDPATRDTLRSLRPGSTVRKVPQSILQEYRQSIRWRQSLMAATPALPAEAPVATP